LILKKNQKKNPHIKIKRISTRVLPPPQTHTARASSSTHPY
jgi:hypothetical protein